MESYQASATAAGGGLNASFLNRTGLDVGNVSKMGYFVSLSVNLVLIIAGNLSLLISVSRRPKCRMTCFITNLGVADLMVGLVLVLPQIVDRGLMEFYGPVWLCKVKFFSQHLIAYSAAYALVALSIDRVDAISNPLKTSTSKRGLQTGCIIAGSWLFSCLYSLPILFWTHVNIHKRFGRQCKIEFGYGRNVTEAEKQLFWQVYMTANMVTIFVIPVIIVAVCHIALVAIICRSSRGSHLPMSSSCNRRPEPHQPGNQTRKPRQQQAASRTVTRAKVKSVKVTCTIVTVFILCWLPYTVGNFLEVFKAASWSYEIRALIQTLGTLNSAANPIIYLVFNYNQCCHRSSSQQHQQQLQQQQQLQAQTCERPDPQSRAGPRYERVLLRLEPMERRDSDVGGGGGGVNGSRSRLSDLAPPEDGAEETSRLSFENDGSRLQLAGAYV